MKLSYVMPFVLALGASTAATAQSFDFSSPVTTSPTRGAGVWYTDRYAPSGFQASGGKLIESIAAGDLQPAAFNNTQGRAYDLNPGVHNLSIDLTVDSAWANTNKRWAGMWGVGVNPDASQNVTAYPILEFTTDGGIARFRGYNVNDGSWADLLAGSVVFGNTYTLNIALVGNTFTYSVGGASASVTSLSQVASIGSVILQGHNAGANYNITWDNLNAQGTAVPEPATWMMMIGGFGLVGGALRRRRVGLATA